MSNEVAVKYGDDAASVAQSLLAAARSLDVDTSVVKTTSRGVFVVPEEVADKAGLSYEVLDEETPEAPEAQPEPEDEAESQNESEPEDEKFDASGFKGEALNEALQERGLSTEGKADEKRARLAEFENNKE